jgi:hypothetical protein
MIKNNPIKKISLKLSVPEVYLFIKGNLGGDLWKSMHGDLGLLESVAAGELEGGGHLPTVKGHVRHLQEKG